MSKQHFAEEDFLITDPEKHPGVVLEVPAGVRPLRLESIGYRAATEVKCAFCRNRQRHIYGFFAVLPDGSLALCGNCCAIEIADKSTVAKIKRDVKRREIFAKNMIVIRELTRDLPEVLELLEQDFFPVEQQVRDVIETLELHFPTSRGRWNTSKKLGLARGGLVSILKITDRLDDRGVVSVLEKRQKIFVAIREGLIELEAAAKWLRPGPLKHTLSNLVWTYGEKVLVRGHDLVVEFWAPDPDDFTMEILEERIVRLPAVEMPDKSELMALIT